MEEKNQKYSVGHFWRKRKGTNCYSPEKTRLLAKAPNKCTLVDAHKTRTKTSHNAAHKRLTKALFLESYKKKPEQKHLINNAHRAFRSVRTHNTLLLITTQCETGKKNVSQRDRGPFKRPSLNPLDITVLCDVGEVAGAVFNWENNPWLSRDAIRDGLPNHNSYSCLWTTHCRKKKFAAKKKLVLIVHWYSHELTLF